MSIPKDVLDQFRDGFDREEYLVEAIKTYLRTEEQRQWLNNHDFSIEDVLNGRCLGEYIDVEIQEILFDPWNDILGFRAFGS